SVFAVPFGALKTFSLSDTGEEQITGFHLPSELVGLSAMDGELYPVSALALETTSICEIPFERLDELSAHLPQLRRQLMRLMSREIRDDQQMMLLLSKKSADERIATFLVNLSARFRARGFSANQFRLAMSRNEIGNHLGLALEIVSRLFTRFQPSGSLLADGKEGILLNHIELCAMAGGSLDNLSCISPGGMDKLLMDSGANTNSQMLATPTDCNDIIQTFSTLSQSIPMIFDEFTIKSL